MGNLGAILNLLREHFHFAVQQNLLNLYGADPQAKQCGILTNTQNG